MSTITNFDLNSPVRNEDVKRSRIATLPPCHRTYCAPSAQQLLQLLALLRAQQRAEEALRLWLGSTAHGLQLPLGLNEFVRHQRRFWPKGSTNVRLGSPGSFSSLFRSASEQETASNTSLTPTDAEQKQTFGSTSNQGRLLLLGVLAGFKKGKLSLCTTEGHILLTIIKYNSNII